MSLRRTLLNLSEDERDLSFIHINEAGTLNEYPKFGMRSSASPQNYFMLSSFQNIGGSDIDNITRADSYARYGGGSHDVKRYLTNYDKDYTQTVIWKRSIRQQVKKVLGFSFCELEPISIDRGIRSTTLNLSANPGPSYKIEGYNSKLDALPAAREVSMRVFDLALKGKPVPPILAGLGGRPKFKDISGHIKKKLAGKACGRSVEMMDSHETLFSNMFTVPLLSAFKNKLKAVMLGYNKFGPDSDDMLRRMRSFNVFITSDYSQYDSSLGIALIKRAFDVVRFIFGSSRGKKDNVDLLLNVSEEWFLNTGIVYDRGYIIFKKGGNPSGSGWTSIINSIINALILDEVGLYLNRIGAITSKYMVNVYGDDSLFSFSINEKNNERRYYMARDLLPIISSFIKLRFNLDVSPESTHVAVYRTVGIGVPIVPGDIHDYSSIAIKRYRDQLARELGRPLTFKEKMILLEVEPVGGLVGWGTHRWTYIFDRRPKFLSYYWKKDGRMIRPTSEVIMRACHPEGKIRDIDSHRELLVNALIENLNNQHTVNRLMHYLYDADWMQRLHIRTHSDARRSFWYTQNSPVMFRDMSAIRKPLLNSQDERAWYRKQEAVADLNYDDRMTSFMAWFRKIVHKINTVFHPLYGDETAVWQLRRSMRTSLPGIRTFAFSIPNRDVKALRSALFIVSSRNLSQKSFRILRTANFRWEPGEHLDHAHRILQQPWMRRFSFGSRS